MSAKALVALVDGFEEIEVVTIADVLRRGGVETVLASVSGGSSAKGAHGMHMKADASFADAAKDDFDAVILPGGPGTPGLGTEAVMNRLVRQKQEDRFICAICAAPTILVQAGVLEPEQHVTCYPTCVMDLDRPCAGVPVVADGKIITGQAPGSALLFSLVVLKALAGEGIARKVARNMVTDVF